MTWQPVGTLLEQYVYEPYGKVARSDTFHDHPVNRVGHQGLFFERYDAEYTTQNLADNASGLYYNRNRFYHPGLGRFTSRDIVGTGLCMPAPGSLADLAALENGVDPEEMFIDGMNIYSYVRNTPVTRRDPFGTFSWGEDGLESIQEFVPTAGAQELGWLAGAAVSYGAGWGPRDPMLMLKFIGCKLRIVELGGKVGIGLAGKKLKMAERMRRFWSDKLAPGIIGALHPRIGVPLSIGSTLLARQGTKVYHAVAKTFGGLKGYAVGLSAFAGFYTGVLDTMMYSIETDTYGAPRI